MGAVVKRLVGGIFFLCLGVSLSVWMWHMAGTEGHYYPKMAWLGPMVGVLGLAILLLPNYRDERAARGEDTTSLEGPSLLTTRWWIVLGVGLVAGAINGVLIELKHGGDPWPTLGGLLLAAVVMYRMFRQTEPKGTDNEKPPEGEEPRR
jgi:4-hydroxybenzoate polyprenyltransferase